MVRFLGLAQIAPFSGAHIKKMAKSSFQGENGINWKNQLIIKLRFDFNQCIRKWSNLSQHKKSNLSQGTVSQLNWHVYGLFDTKYQMSVCDNG